MSDDLFTAAAAERLARHAPLADRLRPAKLDDVVGQDHLLAPGAPLRALIETDRLSSLILWGPPGTGKTTLARIIATETSKAFEPMSAVSASVKDVREVIVRAHQRLGELDRRTILFLDEVHRFNKAQQDALLPSVESGLLVLIGATTENPYFEVNPPLLSRSTIYRLHPLDEEAVSELLHRGLALEGATADDEAIAHVVPRVGGDGRQALTTIEVAIAIASARNGDRHAAKPPGGAAGETEAVAEGRAGEAEGRVAQCHEEQPHITLRDVEAALGTKALRYGRDDHYDVISAFIKSIRGSDVDAGLYWLATMLEAGEDPRFIARRLVILASEDVGMADPMGLVVADAAARSVEFVGLPEAAINLAHAVIYLARAPKSNRVIAALGRATDDVKAGRGGEVPMHLRDASYRSAARLGHGAGYKYPHDDPRGWVEQEYRPEGVAGRVYYEDSEPGPEQPDR